MTKQKSTRKGVSEQYCKKLSKQVTLLSEQIKDLNELFSRSYEHIKETEEDPMITKLNLVVEQNEKIAKAILTLVDLVKETSIKHYVSEISPANYETKQKPSHDEDIFAPVVDKGYAKQRVAKPHMHPQTPIARRPAMQSQGGRQPEKPSMPTMGRGSEQDLVVPPPMETKPEEADLPPLPPGDMPSLGSPKMEMPTKPITDFGQQKDFPKEHISGSPVPPRFKKRKAL